MQDVASEAGVSKAILPHLFDSRENLTLQAPCSLTLPPVFRGALLPLVP